MLDLHRVFIQQNKRLERFERRVSLNLGAKMLVCRYLIHGEPQHSPQLPLLIGVQFLTACPVKLRRAAVNASITAPGTPKKRNQEHGPLHWHRQRFVQLAFEVEGQWSILFWHPCLVMAPRIKTVLPLHRQA